MLRRKYTKPSANAYTASFFGYNLVILGSASVVSIILYVVEKLKVIRVKQVLIT